MFFACRRRLAALLLVPIAAFLASCHLFRAASTQAGMGQEVVDGKFAFIVNNVGTRARGVWMIVSTAVRNVGTHAHSFEMAAQRLKDSDGRGPAAGFMEPPSVNKIDPGLQVTVKLAFDVTPGVRSTQIVLHGSPSSPGTPVNLAQPPSPSPSG